MGALPFEPRAVAGEVLEAMAYERFKEVALGIERALGRLPDENPALTELPYLVAEVGEGSSVRLIAKFLAHKSSEVVASAIEALVELGDPAGAQVLGPLVRDQRQLEDDGAGLVSIGALAEEARELLGELGESIDQGARGPAPEAKKAPPPKAGKPRR
jgi:HEAT repeat protein